LKCARKKVQAFKFKRVPIEDVESESMAGNLRDKFVEHSRIIPTGIKLEVWARDGGRCITCGASDELHFDHIVPFSKGGTALKAGNIEFLCGRHNL
jgi:5-methylcytosine-specific restriction endonuclease McrA